MTTAWLRESHQLYKSKPLIYEQVAIHCLHRLDLADEAVHVPGEFNVAADDGSVSMVKLLKEVEVFYVMMLVKLVWMVEVEVF